MKKSYSFIPQFSWLYMDLLIWIITMLVAYEGFQRFSRYTTKVVYIYAVLFSFLIFITFFHETVGIHPDSCNPGFKSFSSIEVNCSLRLVGNEGNCFLSVLVVFVTTSDGLLCAWTSNIFGSCGSTTHLSESYRGLRFFC